MKTIFFKKPIKILLATNGVVLVAVAMLGPIYALFVDEIGGTLLDASITAGVMALAAGVTTLISGRWVDKLIEDELVVVAGYLLLGIGFLLYTAVESIGFLLFVQVVIGIAEAIYSPAFDALYSEHLTPKKAGSQWAAWESMNYLTLGFGAILGGFIVTKLGFNFMFVSMSALCIGSAAYVYFLPRKLL